MNLPKYHETFIQILDLLKDGKAMHRNELRQAVCDKYYSHLPQDLLSRKTKSGDSLVLNRIGWGVAYLKMAKMVVSPERGLIRITKKGQEIMRKQSFTLKDLQEDLDFQLHRRAKEEVKSDILQVDNENSTPQDMIEFGVHSIEMQVKQELLEKLKGTNPYYFEKVVLMLLKKMGYGDFIETSKSGDGGIDGIINEDQLGLEKIYMQAKRYSDNKVRESEIRNFIGAMSGDTSKGIFVTTSTFDAAAIKKAKEAHHSIVLIEGEKLAELMLNFGVGVQVKSTYEVKEVDEDFFEQ
jgi:restriction system protein